MKRLRPDDERRTHRVEGELLKVITRLFGQDLVDHERLVAPPGSLELPRGGEPQLGLTVHALPPCAARPFFGFNAALSLGMRQVWSLAREVAPAGVHALK